MAQIPTSSITMAAIKAESGASATGTLDACRTASVAYTMTSTSVPGHTRDGTEQTNTNADNWNNTMAEWAGYTHATLIGIQSYGVRFNTVGQSGWPTGGWGLSEEATMTAPTSSGPDYGEADGGIYLFTIDYNDRTLLKADLIANIGPLDGNDPGEGRYYTTGGSAQGTTFGSYSTNGPPGNQAPNNNAITIATFDETGVTVTAVRNPIYSSHEGKDAPTGMTDNATYGTAVLVANSNAGAPYVECEGPGCTAEEDAVWRLRLTATKSGFADTPVDGGLAGGELTIYGSHNAYSDGPG